jgi:hypothetical protein
MSRSNSIAGFRSASETSTCAPTTNASGIIDENSHISSLRVPKGHENSIPIKEIAVWDRAPVWDRQSDAMAVCSYEMLA